VLLHDCGLAGRRIARATPIFQASDVVDSRYLDDTFRLLTYCGRSPQFDGNFEGASQTDRNSWYHSLQIRFQKRMNHYVSFEGNYTSPRRPTILRQDARLVGNLVLDNPQVLDNLPSRAASVPTDAPHRLTTAFHCGYSGRPGALDWKGMNRCWTECRRLVAVQFSHAAIRTTAGNL